tara:strand:- start:189 stop:776 length:588 start_codon:yes stop_codon:yes gene_type:complete
MSGKRDRILESAEREFLLHGFDGTSIDRIVREVGGSKSTVYAHFSDKSVLFAEVLAAVRTQLDFRLPHHLGEETSSAEERLRLALVELLSVLYRERAVHLIRLLTAEGHRFPEVVRQFWAEGPAVATEVLAERIGELCRERGTSSDSVRSIAERAVAAATGGRYLQVLLGLGPIPTADEIAALAGECLELVANAL